MTFRRSSIAAGFALVLAADAAQAQQTTTPQPDTRPRQGAERDGRGMRGMRPGRALMRGITLTDAQKQQVRAIDQKYQSQTQSLRESLRPAMQEARAARQRGDTTAARRAWDRTADQRRQLTALQERRIAEVRGVLTAEQQRQFDANRAEMKSRMEERQREGRDGAHRSGRRGGRGARGPARG